MNNKIARYFTLTEITCRCGCGQNIINQDLLEVMDIFRDIVGNPIIVHCVNRCKLHNYKIGGHQKSWHIQGAAMDFHVRKMSVPDLHNIAKDSRNILKGGLGIYSWGVHVDIGPSRFWEGY